MGFYVFTFILLIIIIIITLSTVSSKPVCALDEFSNCNIMTTDNDHVRRSQIVEIEGELDKGSNVQKVSLYERGGNVRRGKGLGRARGGGRGRGR
ncbi:hypothetical protein RclHR1_00820001 [Rhizophagus clarus]|nr:hypothetical protein RclHR1_00820001 [Rhizophagus clarus]